MRPLSQDPADVFELCFTTKACDDSKLCPESGLKDHHPETASSITVKRDHTAPGSPHAHSSHDPHVCTHTHTHPLPSGSVFHFHPFGKFSLFIIRSASSHESTTEADNSNIFPSFINTGFPLHVEHQGLHYTHTDTHGLVDYVALCTCTTGSSARRRSPLSQPSPQNFTLCDDSGRCAVVFLHIFLHLPTAHRQKNAPKKRFSPSSLPRDVI